MNIIDICDFGHVWKSEMKKVILTIAAAALLVPAFAQKAPKEIACAVMASHKVNIAKATKAKMFADYKGKRYFFCCEGCPATFKADPSKFAKAPSIPTPKKGK